MERMKAILVLVSSIAFAVAPIVSPPFAGYRPDQFPVPQIDPPIQPPGWTFSIWLLIYVWLIVSAVYGLAKRADDPAWDHPRWPLFLSLCFGAAWLPVATISPIWATVLIWAMLVAAVLALFRAPRSETPWLAAPLGLYAGWLTAAACVSTAITFTGYGMEPVMPTHLGLLCLALAIGIGVLLQRAEPFYGLALAWALVGVMASNLFPPQYLFLIVGGAGLLIIGWLCLPRDRAA
ncbi:tryptophan-rich sensory protein [Pseudooceanicola sp. LIPI14-2-Ac024]|uniref:tryptophan-rich sensory protein n=1 Tax=Pseudooceanicola sp. LIPI14-2-Ac024 TaxID=3344875 RepID=UPI0035CFEBC8